MAGERNRTALRPLPSRRSAHFILQTIGEQPYERLEREALQRLEKWYRRYRIQFEVQPPDPMAVLLYPRPAFHNLTGAPAWADGEYDGKGVLRVATSGGARMDDNLERILAHELAHAFIEARSSGKAPRWLQEGLAQYLAPHTVASAAPLPAGMTLNALDHAGSLGFIRALIQRHGLAALMDVLAALSQGMSQDEGFRRVTGLTARAQFIRWRAGHPLAPAAASGKGGP
ncbi:MAG: hypothetical protein ACE5HD_11410 [Acidobacteriota bacterium]